jgi:hypothetical protein
MLNIVLLAAAAAGAGPSFPEQVPGLTERCIRSAIDERETTEEERAHKYMCTGEAAERLWVWLEQAKLPSWEQDTPQEGRWLSREFPLGACFKRIRDAGGRATDTGLSCSIWIPRGGAASDMSDERE